MKLNNLKQRLRRRYNWLYAPFPEVVNRWIRSQWGAYNYICKQVDLPLKYVKEYPHTDEHRKTIWIFWNQGEEKAPELVKKCINSARRYCPKDWTVSVLDIDSAKNLSDLPAFIWERYTNGVIPNAQFSDLLRTSLLLRWGGIWADSTVFWTSQIPNDIISQPLFLFQSPLLTEYASPIKCSSWFIKADKNNPLLARVLDLLLQYHEKYQVLIHYYIYHLTIAALINNNAKLFVLWDNIPYYDNNRPHIMQNWFGKSYSEERWGKILEQSFVHKLTYKYDKKLLDDKDNVLNYILNNYE